MTADLDIVLDLERENVLKALAALGDLGFRPRAPVRLEDFADPRERQSWIDEKGLTVFSLWSPTLAVVEIDIFVEEPFVFAEAFERASGRPLDLDDIRALEAIRAMDRKS
jgi:hypothetical protein